MTTRTNDEMIGELTRKNEQDKQLMAAYCEPIKLRVKEREKQIGRLLLEDGRQQVDMGLLGD